MEKKFDYILHVGVGLPGGYEVEMVAHEKGYVKADVDGLIPGGVPADPEKEKKNKSGDTGKDSTTEVDGGAIYKTELNVQGICEMIEACGIKVRSRLHNDYNYLHMKKAKGDPICIASHQEVH